MDSMVTVVKGKHFWWLATMVPLTLLWGCTADWKAPVETRERSTAAVVDEPSSTKTYSVTSPIRGDRYTVKAGDTLIGIAFEAETDYQTLARWNNLSHPYVIYPGQKIRLNAPKKPAANLKEIQVKSAGARKRIVKKPEPRARSVSSSALTWHWPTSGKVISTYNPAQQRKGIKIAGTLGTDIKAVEGGKVVYAGSGLIGYGRLIIVKHNDRYLSAYAHNKQLLVKQGDKVTQGMKIATMGEATAGQALLHFEIRRDGKPVNPLGLLPKR